MCFFSNSLMLHRVLNNFKGNILLLVTLSDKSELHILLRKKFDQKRRSLENNQCYWKTDYHPMIKNANFEYFKLYYTKLRIAESFINSYSKINIKYCYFIS